LTEDELRAAHALLFGLAVRISEGDVELKGAVVEMENRSRISQTAIRRNFHREKPERSGNVKITTTRTSDIITIPAQMKIGCWMIRSRTKGTKIPKIGESPMTNTASSQPFAFNHHRHPTITLTYPAINTNIPKATSIACCANNPTRTKHNAPPDNITGTPTYSANTAFRRYRTCRSALEP
jgi:hypothetical protein